METMILYPQNKEQLSALKAFAKALKVDFKTEKGSYSPEFVAKMEESKKQAKEGKVVSYTIAQLEELCK